MKKLIRSLLALLLVSTMLFSMAGIGISAASAQAQSENSISYVALGASNTNGFGLMGYLPDELYGNPVNKMSGSVYGYQMEAEAAYPHLVAEELSELSGMTVELEQLAISSMRAEELHVLLDNSYYGDKYTEWRFTGGQNWFNMANPNGLDGLRAEYQNYVAEADVITVDIGANNFGVYASNRIFNNMFDADFTRFDSTTQLLISEAKAAITDLVEEYAEDMLTDELSGTLEHVIDTLTYAFVGYCVNFDASMERIYELNPDAVVVVVNIQNLLYGIEATLPGVDGTIPLGEIYGAVIDLANTYAAQLSPYSGRYYYAYIGEDGQAETFLRDIRDYTGNPADLRTAVTDCFDVYDNDMYLKTRVLQALVNVYADYVSVSPDSGYTVESLSQLDTFSSAVYDNAVILGGVPVQSFLSYGAAGQLPDALQEAYELYESSLLTVYDTAATFMKAGASSTVMDIAAAAENFSSQGKEVLNTFFAWLLYSMEHPGFEVEKTPEYAAFMSDPVNMAIITLGVRSDLGNSFFSHPNENGHEEIKDAIINALVNGIYGRHVNIFDEIYYATHAVYAECREYTYTAIGDRSSMDGYADKLAEALGIGGDSYNNLASDGLFATDTLDVIADNAEIIAGSDIVSVGYSSNAFLDEAVLQLNLMMMGRPVAVYDWDTLLGEDGAAQVDNALTSLRATLEEEGLDVNVQGRNVADMLTVAVEAYAYRLMGYLTSFPAVAEGIHSIAPDALVILVGMYNSLDGVVVSIEDTEIDIGEYIQYVVDIVGIENLVYAAASKNTIFVAAPDVETVAIASGSASSYDFLGFVWKLLLGGSNDFYATDAGNEYIKDQILASLIFVDHDYTSETTSPTCTEKGYTTYSCDCGDSYVSDYVDANGHSYGEWTVTTSATCTEVGAERRDCANCDHYETREVPALGHDKVTREAKSATCTEIGWDAYETCTICDYTTYVEIPATGHSYGEWTVTTSATCTEVGAERRDCANCDHYETREVSALGHDKVTHEAKSATCTEIGWDAYETCTRCDYTTYVEIPTTGHSYGEWTETTASTCTEAGEETRTCTCGDAETREIVALGHDFAEDFTVDVEATVDTVGQKSRHCTRCDEVTDVTEIPKLVADIDSSKIFKDVKAKSWFKGAVDYVVSHELMNGMTADTFEPNTSMSRAMLVTVLWRMDGSPEAEANVPFTDLKQAWYKEAVAWAYENGIVLGTSETQFAPNASITREQMAAILYRYSEYKGYDTTARADISSYPDAGRVHDYSLEALSWANAEELITGTSDTDGTVKLAPRASATRAQVATILQRFCEGLSR